MRIHARLHGFSDRERDVSLREGATARDLLAALDIRPDMVLVFRGDRPIADTAPLSEGETLRVLRIVTGG